MAAETEATPAPTQTETDMPPLEEADIPPLVSGDASAAAGRICSSFQAKYHLDLILFSSPLLADF